MLFKNVAPQKQALIKFLLLLVILVVYVAYLSYEYGLMTGGLAAILTWSFFVLCTPIADAGFLLDFPLRLLFGIRMIHSELTVWTIAVSLNTYSLLFRPGNYDTTILTRLLHHILTHPWPYWSVILLSCAGTFLSIRFGDELMDVIHHRDRAFFHSNAFKHELILIAFFGMVVFSYYELIASLGLDSGSW
ncbi:hypothetical protein [Emcibacter nanhaiensis]|uniref:Uncharacterized protein n=1 Tax=Emcibacter nanhaiensis TaxID=1505037 RepID=A0A501PBP9_9PROT|nr:hypothetical protein [Emcibacter nanhaiensis]TPD57432.1 hypothetical protein FIV46_15025 [Emcibacter nanhaiensis]